MKRSFGVLVCCLVLSVMAGAGCFGSKPTTGEKGSTPAEDPNQGRPIAGKKNTVPVPIKREVASLEGHWAMVFTAQGQDLYVWIIRIFKDDEGKLTAEMVDNSNDQSSCEMTGSKIEGNSVRIDVKNAKAALDFQGQFDGHIVRGTFAGPMGEMLIARMLPTDTTALKGHSITTLPPGTDVFRAIGEKQKENPDPAVVLTALKEIRTSPLGPDAVAGLLALSNRMNYSDQILSELIDETNAVSKVWGPRLEAKLKTSSGVALLQLGRSIPLAIQQLEDADKLLGDEHTAWKKDIASYLDTGRTGLLIEKMHSKNEADQDAAAESLKGVLARQPYHSNVLWELAKHAESRNQVDAAINYYTDIVAMPMLEKVIVEQLKGQPPSGPLPGQSLFALWNTHRGESASLLDHLAERYKTRMEALLKEVQEKGPKVVPSSGQHTVLMELFTAGQAPACVAAEMATMAISQTYPNTDVMVLRYHQHINGADPLVNQDAEDRATQYEVAGVPLVYVDGLPLAPPQFNYAGLLQDVSDSYQTLRNVVDIRRKIEQPIQLELEAEVVNGDLTLKVETKGLTEEMLSGVRLRMALAEEAVEAAMPIGIRRHEMIVREMPGGAKGVPPKKGELKYFLTTPMADVQRHIDEYVSRYEAGNKIEFPVFVKPPIRGPLYFVAWIQSEKVGERNLREVFQTAVIPVKGFVPPPLPEKPKGDVNGADQPSDTPKRPPAPALPE